MLLAGAVLGGTGAGSAAATTAATNADFRTEALGAEQQRGASAARSAAGPSRTTTLRLRSAKRFSLVGLQWQDASSVRGRLRAKRTDGTWTPWQTLESEQRQADGVTEGSDARKAAAARATERRVAAPGSTEPIWTGPARVLEVELQGRAPRGLRAAFVDVSGFKRFAARAARTSDQAGIAPRSAWDPYNECKPRMTPGIGTVQAVTVHHTAGSNLYTQAQVPGVILAICKYHRNGQGWNDIGYNVLVDKFGGAWEGRAGGLTQAVIGAHAMGFNAVSAGVSMIGDYMASPPPAATLATVSRVAAWKLAVAGTPQAGTVTLTSGGGSQARYKSGTAVTLPRIFAHRDVGLTDCPGNAGYATLDQIRSAAGASNPTLPANIPSQGTPVSLRITISTRRALVIGARSVVRGTVSQGGRGVAGAEVALQTSAGDTWSTVAKTTANSAGKYRFSQKFTRNWRLRVVATGATAGQSAAVKMTVAPKLRLTVPKRLRVGSRRTLKGSIAPGRGPVTLEVARRSAKGTYVLAKPVKVTQRGRRLSVVIKPHSAALYRFRLVYEGSSLAAPARTPWQYGRGVRSTSSGGGASL